MGELPVRFYRCRIPVEHLALAVEIWFKKKDFETQRFGSKEQMIVQARKGGLWASVAGMAQALTVRLKAWEGGVEVHTGAGKWLDKAAAGGVGWFMFWPLAVTAGVGVYQQAQLGEQLLTFLEHYVREADGDYQKPGEVRRGRE